MSDESAGSSESDRDARAPTLRLLPPSRIDVNPSQPRREFSAEALEALGRSIAKEGLLQPILVRPWKSGYQLIAGERRLRAAQALGLEEIPARVVDLGTERLLEVALVENIHRSDLNPIELAEAYEQLRRSHGWTQEQLAESLGVRRSSVANALRLLELDDDMQRAVARGRISTGHAKVLLSVSDPGERKSLFDKIAEDNLSIRELEDARETSSAAESEDDEATSGSAGKRGGRGGGRRGPGAKKKPYLVSLEEELTSALGMKVRISERRGGRGTVAIEFYSKDDFEKLRSLLSRK